MCSHGDSENVGKDPVDYNGTSATFSPVKADETLSHTRDMEKHKSDGRFRARRAS